jgi:hypothetical protein
MLNHKSVIDVTTQVKTLYPQLFVSPNNKTAAIIADEYKNVSRTPKNTLTTVWVGINDIGLTYNWTDTDALDKMIMKQYKGLLVRERESIKGRLFVIQQEFHLL